MLDKTATPATADASAAKPGEVTAAKPGEAGDTAAPTYTTPEQVQKAIDTAQQQRDQTAQQRAARDAFTGTRLKNIPDAYKRLLGNDPAAWEAEAKTIAAQFQADLKSLGVKIPEVGGDITTGGVSPLGMTVNDTRTPTQKIAAGLAKKN